jgi:AraC-like DNA-binding protein
MEEPPEYLGTCTNGQHGPVRIADGFMTSGEVPHVFFNAKKMNLTTDLYQRIAAAKIYIDENFHEPIDLDSISRQAFLSRFHFHRIFTQVYRFTPHQYLTRKRIDKARDLLADNRQVTEVCTDVGFESIGSFSMLFKREIGFAPQYYRNMAFKKKTEQLAEPKLAIPHCFLESCQPGSL